MEAFFKFIQSNTGVADMLAAIAFTIAALYAWRDLNWRVKNLELWQNRLDVLMEKQVAILASTETNTVELKAIARGVDRRLVMLEELQRRGA